MSKKRSYVLVLFFLMLFSVSFSHNVFAYGPDYPVAEKPSLTARVLSGVENIASIYSGTVKNQKAAFISSLRDTVLDFLGFTNEEPSPLPTTPTTPTTPTAPANPANPENSTKTFPNYVTNNYITNTYPSTIIKGGGGSTSGLARSVSRTNSTQDDTLANLQTQIDALSGGGSSQWTTAGSDIYYATGNVGIGTTTPTYDLDVNGDINFTGSLYQNGSLFTSGGSFSTSTTRGVFSSSATGLSYATSTGIFSLSSGYEIPLTASTTEWASGYTNRITSVTNSDGTLTISPTTGAVVASLGLAKPANGGFGISNAKTDITTTGTINDQAVATGWLNFTGSASVSITGFVAQAAGVEILITNNTTSTVTLSTENVSSSAANRISGSISQVLQAKGSLRLKYNITTARWNLVQPSIVTYTSPLSLNTSNAVSMTAATASVNGYVTTGDQSFAGLKNFTNNLHATTIGDTINVPSVQLNSRQLLVNNGSTISVDWSGTPNGSASLSFDGSESQFSGQTRFGGDMDDSSGNKFLDPYNRVLYASDGSTSMLDFLNSSSAGVIFNSSGTFTGRLGSATEAVYAIGTGGTVYLVDGTYAINAAGVSRFVQTSSGTDYDVTIGYSSGSDAIYSVATGSWSAGYFANGSNTVQLGDGTYAIDATGDISASGDITGANVFSDNYDLESLGASDNRYKENISPIASSTLDKILALNPVTYNWNQTYLDMYPNTRDASSTKLGFIAQEMELVFPEVVIHKNDGFLAIDYGKLTAALTQGMKEVYAIVNDMKTKIQSMLAWFGGDGSKFDVQGDVCVDDVCVTKEQFKQIILDAGGTGNSDEGEEDDDNNNDDNTSNSTPPTDEVVPPDGDDEGGGEEVIIEEEPEPETVPEPEPEPETQPAPEEVPAV